MVSRNKKNYFEKLFFNQKFLTLLGLAVIIFLSFPFAKNAIKQYRVNKEISDLKKEIADLQNKNGALKDFVSYLDSDQFAEEKARLNLGLKKPGEELVITKTSDAGGATATSGANNIFSIPGYQKEVPNLKIANPQKWVNYFFK